MSPLLKVIFFAFALCLLLLAVSSNSSVLVPKPKPTNCWDQYQTEREAILNCEHPND